MECVENEINVAGYNDMRFSVRGRSWGWHLMQDVNIKDLFKRGISFHQLKTAFEEKGWYIATWGSLTGCDEHCDDLLIREIVHGLP